MTALSTNPSQVQQEIVRISRAEAAVLRAEAAEHRQFDWKVIRLLEKLVD